MWKVFSRFKHPPPPTARFSSLVVLGIRRGLRKDGNEAETGFRSAGGLFVVAANVGTSSFLSYHSTLTRFDALLVAAVLMLPGR